jgi:hypothetical protein
VLSQPRLGDDLFAAFGCFFGVQPFLDFVDRRAGRQVFRSQFFAFVF